MPRANVAGPVPSTVVAALANRPGVGEVAEAFTFATTDADGTPHLILLSSRELLYHPDGTLRVVLAGRQSPTNLRRTGRATLLVVADDAAHTLTLELQRAAEVEGTTGAVVAVRGCRTDDVGVPLSPLTYTITDDLPIAEAWARSATVLAALADAAH